ncbi:MAG: metallophosphoesterase [Oscillospiraceae bacterium]|nr:metallophosphoesterase [Oscillospiraceae bacterium]
MVYITGDTHGDFSRFKNAMLKKADANDILIVCGDFGFFWDDSKKEQKLREKLMNLRYTVAFVDGCHENYDMLEAYPVEDWSGGKARIIAPNIIHLLRGEIYTICGKRFFTFGGGHSQDFEYRTAENWWEREQPTYEEILHAAENLKSYDNTVDYIITHEPPASLKDCLRVDMMQRLEVHAFFEDLTQICTFRQWYFGKCHLNRYVPVKYYAVFDNIYPLRDTQGKALSAQYDPDTAAEPEPVPEEES